MSQNSKPNFKSRLPRPVAQHTNLTERSIKVDSHQKGLRKPSEQECVALNTRIKHESLEEKFWSKPDVIASSENEVKKEISCSDDEFQADPKALESILSNKGVTAELFSDRPSTAQQLQSMKRSSMYYQSPSRMSMMDSHSQFKEKMKLLKEQMKSLNIKCGGTPKSAHEKTSSTTPSVRPVSLYYHTKPSQSQRKPSTPTQTTPLAMKPQHLSMSERKLLVPKDSNSNRLCHTVSKLDTKPHRHDQPSAYGKENKVRFNLFPSPIHEVPENTSPQGNEISSSDSSAKTKLLIHTENGKRLKTLSKESYVCPWKTTVNKDISTMVSSSEHKDLIPLSELMPSTPLSLHIHSNKDSCPTNHSTNTCTPVMSASTSSTWSIKNSICTPKSSVPSPAKVLLSTHESITPDHRIFRHDQERKDGLFAKSPANTPSRVVCTNGGVLKAPQRTITSQCLQLQRKTPQRKMESINSGLRTKTTL